MFYALSGALARFTATQLLLIAAGTVMFLLSFLVLRILKERKKRRQQAENRLYRDTFKTPPRHFLQDDIFRDEFHS